MPLLTMGDRCNQDGLQNHGHGSARGGESWARSGHGAIQDEKTAHVSEQRAAIWQGRRAHPTDRGAQWCKKSPDRAGRGGSLNSAEPSFATGHSL
jgi:hypothetical protein